jgi:F-type H+-transporting ATPase subunit b
MATTTTEAANTAAAAGHDAAEAVGMPQLDFSTWANQIFWLVVTLVVIFLILSRIALPRIASVLADRQGTITNDIVSAEELKKKAGEAEDAYNQALADARAEAQRIIAKTKAEMAEGLAEAIRQADADISVKAGESEQAIAEIRAGALEAIKSVAGDTAAAIVAKLGSTADADAISKAVDAQMKG